MYLCNFYEENKRKEMQLNFNARGILFASCFADETFLKWRNDVEKRERPLCNRDPAGSRQF